MSGKPLKGIPAPPHVTQLILTPKFKEHKVEVDLVSIPVFTIAGGLNENKIVGDRNGT